MDIKDLHRIFLQSNGIVTDTRKVEKGQLFFSLKGDNFNGNEFAAQAIEKGALYAVIDQAVYDTDSRYILVSDVLNCLQELAQFHRIYLKIPIIAITGTNGKTTSKELIRSALQVKYKVGYTRGNLNNHIGVPLTLLSFTQDTEIGVVEMGANHANEIAELCKIARPDYGVITNIGKAHLEGFGSFEGVINAKCEMYSYLKKSNKVVFVNGDDEILVKHSEGTERIKYGKDNSYFCQADFVEASPFLVVKWEDQLIKTQLVGEYNFSNVLVAICIGKYLKVNDIDIINALSAYKPDNNRSQLTTTEKNILIIDAYNANPSSMALSILNFQNIKDSNKLLILGDMFELGETSMEEHQKIIELVVSKGFKNVFFVGKHFGTFQNKFNTSFDFFENTSDLIEHLTINEIKGRTVLLKASRGIQLEKIIPYL